MSKIPTIRRLIVEDFPDQKKWIGKLFESLNTFIINVVQAFTSQITISENMLGQIDKVRVRTALHYSAPSSAKGWLTQDFVDGDVNTGTEEITLTAHPFQTTDKVQLSSTGVLPTGLSLNTDYFVISIDANTIQLASSLSNALAAVPVNITAAAGGGTHSIYNWVSASPYVALFDPAKFSIRFKGGPVFVMLGFCTEVAGNQVINTQATTIDWSAQNGVVTINAVSGLRPGQQYDLIIYTSGG